MKSIFSRYKTYSVSIIAGLTSIAWAFTQSAMAAEPQLTLYLPFDGDIQPKISSGNTRATYSLPTEAPQFGQGIRGQGLLTGAPRQNISLPADGNIATDAWTISFWVKGLPGAKWNHGTTQERTLQMFWGLFGLKSEILWFYRYPDKQTPWLYYRPKQGEGKENFLFAPAATEEQWHYWVVTWRKEGGAALYLDGQAVGRSAFAVPQPVQTITIGQEGSKAPQNKIIDEFKIYDGALSAGQVARQYWQEGNFALNPKVTVAPALHNIVIDGKIDPAEWQGTARFTGLLDQQQWSSAQPATYGRIAYDEKFLYLALHSDTPQEVKLSPDTTALHGFVKRDAVQTGPAVKDDDYFFWHIAPSSNAQKWYAFFANGIDTAYGQSKTEADATPVSWPVQARVKSQIGMDGWTMEAAIPLLALGVHDIADQETWRMNIGRVWRMLRQRTDVWVNNALYDSAGLNDNEYAATLQFARHQVVTEMQTLDIDNTGRVVLEAALSNRNQAASTVTAILSVGGTVLQRQDVVLQPAQSQSVTLTALPEAPNGSLLEFKVLSGEHTVFSQSYPLILEQTGYLQYWSYPSTGQLRFGWELPDADKAPEYRLQAKLQDTTGKTVLQQSWEQLAGASGSLLWDIKTLADGPYTLDLQMVKGAAILQRQAFHYEKKPLPEWFGNRLGLSETPPPPWTDIVVDKSKDSFAIWGRRYEFAGHLLPQQIVNRNQPMLAAPMRLVVRDNEDTTHSSATGTATTHKAQATPVRADYSRSQDVGNLHLNMASYLEFDGMVWTQLTVTPRQTAAAVKGLNIEIPLKAEWAELLRPFGDYRLQQTGRLPAQGWKGKASSMPWIGNGNGGIQFFQESTATWIGSKSVEVIPHDKQTVILRLNLIDTPVMLDKPLQFAFGWIVSPVKPAPRDHRDWRLIDHSKLEKPSQSTNALSSYVLTRSNPKIKWSQLWWQGWWWLPEKTSANSDITGFVPVPAGNGREKAIYPYQGIPIDTAPYGRLSQIGSANPWFEQFADEWVADGSKFIPDTASPKSQQKVNVSQASQSLNDFFAWGYNRLINEGQVHTLYFDVSRILPDSNPYRNEQERQTDGSIEPSFNILGMRQAFRRIYTLLHAKHPDARLFYHMSGEIMLPVYSFSDGLVDGENFTGMLDRKENRGYENILSLDQFRTEFSTQNNFGPASVMLAEFERAKSILPEEWETLGLEHAQYLLGLVLLHDSTIWWAYMPDEFLARVYLALDKTGLNGDWSFIPYWNQKTIPLPEGVHASLYQSPDKQKTMVVLMNTLDKEQTVQLPLQLDKEIYRSAKGIYPNETSDYELLTTSNISVKPKNFRVILLQK